MKEQIPLVILSHKRADRVDTLETFPPDKVRILVEESQEAEYREHNPDVEIVTHPDSVVGYTSKVKWAYKYFEEMFILDDDLHEMRRKFQSADDLVHPICLPEVAYAIVQNTAFTAREMGVKLFGFGKHANPTTYSGFKPIGITGFVIASSMGILKGFPMDEVPDECVEAAEFYISGLNAFYFRTCFRDDRYAFASREGTFVSTGGMADHRTVDTEKRDMIMLKKAFGDVFQVKKTPSKHIRKLQHRYERTLTLPF